VAPVAVSTAGVWIRDIVTLLVEVLSGECTINLRTERELVNSQKFQ
jgi:hypothetical protein